MSTNQRFQILRLLAVAWLSIGATGCLKSKMTELNAVRTEGADARYLETVPVQTESGQPGLCLYSAQGSPSAPASIDPSNSGGAEVISMHALYQGELIQGLETIPGIDAFRQAALNDLIGPTAVIAGASLAAAGKFVPAGTRLPNPFANGFGSKVTTEARNSLTSLTSKMMSPEAKSFDAAIDALKQTGFEFVNDAGRVTDTYRSSQDGARFQTWINEIETMVDRAPDGDQKQGWKIALAKAKSENRILATLRQQVSSLQGGLDSISNSVATRRIRELGTGLDRALPDGTGQSAATQPGPLSKAQSTVRRAARGLRMSIPEGIKNVCSTGANSNRLVRAGLCLGGLATGLLGVGWMGLGGIGASSPADTDSIRTAIAADAASSPDVVIDANSYTRLIEGLRQFSDRIAADPTIQSMRPTCQ